MEAAQKEQARRVDQWMAKRPNLLSECSPSEATTRDLEEILASIKEVEVLKDRVQLAETILADQVNLCFLSHSTANLFGNRLLRPRWPKCAAQTAWLLQMQTQLFAWIALFVGRKSSPAHLSDTRESACIATKSMQTRQWRRIQESVTSCREERIGIARWRRLVRCVCVFCCLFVFHDRFFFFSCQPCLFHTQGAQPDYQLLLCGFDDCQVPALQCLKHADWREVRVFFFCEKRERIIRIGFLLVCRLVCKARRELWRM